MPDGIEKKINLPAPIPNASGGVKKIGKSGNRGRQTPGNRGHPEKGSKGAQRGSSPG